MNYFRSESMASGATRIEAARWSSKHIDSASPFAEGIGGAREPLSILVAELFCLVI